LIKDGFLATRLVQSIFKDFAKWLVMNFSVSETSADHTLRFGGQMSVKGVDVRKTVLLDYSQCPKK
jgi:hypothetical protein